MNLVVPEPLWHQLRETLRHDGVESAGIALANVAGDGSSAKFLLNKIRFPDAHDYQERGPLAAKLSPEFVASVVRTARDQKMATIFFHTHPFEQQAHFSKIDDAGERLLLHFVDRRVPKTQHAALVLGREKPAARLLGTDEKLAVSVIGPVVQRFGLPESDSDSTNESNFNAFDRQIRALGINAQQHLATLRVCIVGVGGTGSIVAEQLAHLGVANFLLVDADVVEQSNLNRVVGASPCDVGRPKVDVAADFIRRIRPDARIDTLHESILRNSVLRRLTGVDAVFCCTDSHGSRYVLNEFAYRFLVPSFDCGAVIAVDKGVVTHMSARVQMLAPSLSCLTCSNLLDPEQVRRDLLTDYERALDPYIEGGNAPQPAVISLNGATVSLSVTMFLGAFCGFPARSRHQRYDAMRGTVRNIDTAPVENCISCSNNGALAVGDSWPLPGRPD